MPSPARAIVVNVKEPRAFARDVCLDWSLTDGWLGITLASYRVGLRGSRSSQGHPTAPLTGRRETENDRRYLGERRTDFAKRFGIANG